MNKTTELPSTCGLDSILMNPKYDNPDGCKAIVAVAEDGEYLFIKKPNLWMFEAEPLPQNNGFGDSFDLPPGLYSMKFTFIQFPDPTTGMVDDWEFQLTEHKLLYSC